MMALAGVTTALDMSGPVDSVMDIASEYGVGLNLACLQAAQSVFSGTWSTPGGKELSHLSFYNSGVVPVPAAVWLFGSGLIGLIAVARRKQ